MRAVAARSSPPELIYGCLIMVDLCRVTTDDTVIFGILKGEGMRCGVPDVFSNVVFFSISFFPSFSFFLSLFLPSFFLSIILGALLLGAIEDTQWDCIFYQEMHLI